MKGRFTYDLNAIGYKVYFNGIITVLQFCENMKSKNRQNLRSINISKFATMIFKNIHRI